MERLLLLWDELDELAGWGVYVAGGVAFTLARHKTALVRRLRALAPAFDRA